MRPPEGARRRHAGRAARLAAAAGLLSCLAAPGAHTTQYHSIRQGETLTSIAARYGTSVARLRELNGLAGDRIITGQRLLVRRVSHPPGETAGKTAKKNAITGQFYTVRRGDNLIRIANRAGVTVASIRKLNRIKGDIIRPGQQLKLRAAPPPPPPPPEITPNPIMQVSGKIYYKVVKTDTLESVADLFGTERDALRSANLLDGDGLREGQMLVIPPPGWARLDGEGGETAVVRSRGMAVVRETCGYLNTPYKRGGTDRTGIDCAGLTWSVFKSLGLIIPRTSALQHAGGEPVSLDDALPGDLLFFGSGGTVNHVGVYLGAERFVHASTSERKVTVARFDTDYFRDSFIAAKRYFTALPAGAGGLTDGARGETGPKTS